MGAAALRKYKRERVARRTVLFWSQISAIVLARAAYFQPGISDGFGRVRALAGKVTGLF